MTESEKLKLLEQVVSSSEFEGDVEYSQLLAYLVKSTLAGKSLKEYSIAVEHFEKDASFNPATDNYVRYRIYKLRDKLRRYYDHEGQHDAVHVVIPKGHYFVQFEKASKTGRQDKPTVRRLNYWRAAALGLTVVCAVLTILYLRHVNLQVHITEPIPNNDPIWSHFFDNDLPTTICVGDFLIFSERDEQLGYTRRIMDLRINTFDALRQYSESFTDREISRLYFNGELPHNSLHNMVDLLHVFYSLQKPFDIRMSSELAAADLKGRNIIYIGEFSNMRILHSVLSLTSFQIRNLVGGPLHFAIENADTSKNLSFRFTPHIERGEENIDYGFLAKVPGMGDERYLLIAGFEYSSQVELVEMLCCTPALKQLEQKIKEHHGNVPPFFEVLFEVTGYGIVNYNSEILFVDEIDPQTHRERALQALRDREMVR